MSIDNNDCGNLQEQYINQPNIAGLAVIESLLKFHNFSNNMTVKEVKEEIQERLWVYQFGIKFRTFNIVDKDELIGKATVAFRKIEQNYSEEQIRQAFSNYDFEELPNPQLKLAFTFCDINEDSYSRKEGERYTLHRLLCDEPNISTNSKYTKLDNNFTKTVEVSLPFQAYIDNNLDIETRLIAMKEAIIKAANSMQILWMLGMTVNNIK